MGDEAMERSGQLWIEQRQLVDRVVEKLRDAITQGHFEPGQVIRQAARRQDGREPHLAARPGRVREIVDINLPRPRPPAADTKSMAEFVDKRRLIWWLINTPAEPVEAVSGASA